MTKNKLIVTSTILGLSLLIVSPNQDVQAANVTPSCTTTTNFTGTGTLSVNLYSDSSRNCAPPAGWTPKLFAWEGRAGAPRRADYEFALGDNGANVNNNNSQPTSIYRDWTGADNSAAINWVVDYNSVTRLATLTIGSGIGQQSVSYTSTTDTGSSPFNAFSIATKVLGPDGKISVGTTAQMVVDRVTSGADFVPIGIGPFLGQVIADNAPSLTNPSFSQVLFSTGAGEAITKVEGRLALSWTGTNPNTSSARGRVGFLFQAFDPPVTAATPEPLTILGTITAITMGAGLKRKLANKK